MLMYTIRPARTTDIPAITDIYNHEVSTATIKNRALWLANSRHKHPVLVLETDELVVGFASLSPWLRSRPMMQQPNSPFILTGTYVGREWEVR